MIDLQGQDYYLSYKMESPRFENLHGELGPRVVSSVQSPLALKG